jgi:phosphoribosylanthranilate isomerase
MSAVPVLAKICGLSTPADVQAAAEGGAAYVGFVSFPASPRHLEPARAGELAALARAAEVGVAVVTVDAPDALLDALQAEVRPDLFQLHGSETPERAAAVKARTGAQVVRALRVSEPSDLEGAVPFEAVVDRLMFDAKPPRDAELPGGNGAAFDWSILQGRSFGRPWFLAGGLTPANVAEAVAGSGAGAVDVSSGVERAPGVKDPVLIKAFLEAVRRV